LHERLTQRFIDRRTSVLMKRLAQKELLMSTVEEDGAIHVEGEYVGRIKGFNFVPDGVAEGAEARVLKAAALQAVAAEVMARAKAVAVSADPDLKIDAQGQILWHGAAVGRLEAAASLLKPRAMVIAGDQLSGSDREEVQARLQKFADRTVAATLEPLIKLEEGEGLEGIAKGIAFRTVEHLGVLPRELVAEEVKGLSQEDRAKLRALGLRFGAFHLFTPLLLKPAATELRLLLWALTQQKEGKLDVATLHKPPGQGLTSAAFDRTTPKGFYGVCGYRICGQRVVRIDMLERLADLIRDRVFWRPRIDTEKRPSGSVEGGGFTIVPDMMSLVGCSGEEFQGILKSLDFRMQKKKVTREVAAPSAPAESVAHAEPIAYEAPAEAAITLAPPATEEAVSAEAPAEPAPAAVATEEIEIEVWWPRDTGPFRHRQENKNDGARRHHRRPARPAEAEAGSEPKPDGERPRREGRSKHRDHKKRDDFKPREETKPARREKPMDPNSPFAVLEALRAKLAGK
jgi:ATP-dependent RNA helicase SUPV3L1/SUV3